jgi:hypothetical protein
MMKNNIVKKIKLMSVMFAAFAFTSAAFAQEARKPVPAKGLSTLPCCKCVGGTTTTNLSTGTAVWKLIAPTVSATVLSSNAAWTTLLASQIPAAQWISPVGNPTNAGGTIYELKFDTRKCIIPSDIVISGKFLADNSATLMVNGLPVASSIGTPNYGFLPGSLTPFSFTIPAAMANGVQSITVQASNDEGTATGIVVQATATRKCPNERETDFSPIEFPADTTK